MCTWTCLSCALAKNVTPDPMIIRIEHVHCDHAASHVGNIKMTDAGQPIKVTEVPDLPRGVQRIGKKTT